MAYEVTATRRRPGKFEDLIGQDFVVATLQKSLSAGKIAPAYLFSGPRGCGKTSSARILAKSLNCLTSPGAAPCGTCTACREITAGSSLDVIEIDGASNTSVNDVRQIRDEVQFPPNSYRYKVYIIDEVHMLSTSAFNALLKTIEEPPPYVIFVFATTELHKVPATIKSRCQQFAFRLVSVELLKQALADAAAESGISADDEALFWIAREATGSVRDAYTLFDQVASFSDGHITFEKIRDKLGLVGIDRISGIVSACATNKVNEALVSLDTIIESGVSIEQFTVDVADYFRSLLLIKNGITREALLGQSIDRFSREALDAWTGEQLERGLEIFLQLYRDIRYSLDERYELELAVSRLAWLSDYVSSAEMKRAVERAQSVLLGSSPGAPRRDSGPFPEADRTSDREPADAVREEPVADPFADIKNRINGFTNEQPGQDVPSNSLDDHIDNRDPEESSTEISGFVENESCFVASTQTDEGPPVQSEDELVPVPDTPIPLEMVQEKLIEFFRSTRNMLASALAQTYGWKDTGPAVVFLVRKPFLYTTIKQDIPLISASVSRLVCRDVPVEVQLDKTAVEDEAGENEIPEQVERLRRMFKGVILEEGERK